MTKLELVSRLKAIKCSLDRFSPVDDSRYIEEAHQLADAALVEFINDPEVSQAYQKLERWYA